MTILKSLTIKNLKLNKKRTVVTVIGIILATALIVALSSLVFSFKASVVEYEKKTTGDFHYKFFDVPIDEVKYIKNNRDVEKTVITQGIGYAKLENSKNEYKPYLYLQAFSNSAVETLAINLIDGRLPENENEIIISNHIKTNARVKYNVGDSITLTIGKRISDGYELKQNNMFVEGEEEHIEEEFTKTYKIVGIIERPDNSIEPYTAPGYTIITILDESNLSTNNVDVYTRYTKEGLKNQNKVTANILGVNEEDLKSGINIENLQYEYQSNSYLISCETISFSDSLMATIYSVAIIVTIIIMVTSVFCIRNSFAISITEKVKQYGMLASVGTTSKQIKKNVYFEAIVLAIIGIPIGIAFGLGASFILVKVCNVLLQDSLRFNLIYVISIPAVILSLGLSAVTCLLSAKSSARKASKIAPIEAIRGNTDIKINSKKVKSPKFVKKIFRMGGDIAYKNLKRNKKKYRTTVISIVVCVSVFIATSSFVDLAFRTVNIEVGEYDYNIDVFYDDKNAYEKMKEIENLENINRSTIERRFYVEIDDLKYKQEDYQNYHSKCVAICSVGDKEYSRYLKQLGLNYDDCKDKGILINKFTTGIVDEKGNAKKKEISLYDNKRGDILEEEKIGKLEIVDVAMEYPLGLSQMQVISECIIVSDELMNKYQEQFTEFITYMHIDSSNPDKLQDEIEVILQDAERYSINNIDQNVKTMRSMYLLIAIFLYGFIVVIALIGVTNIFNTITTSMELRSKEFAMLKSVGMTTKEFNKMIKLESFFYGTKSLLIGIPIGIGLSYLLFRAILQGIEFSYVLPINGILISFVAVFILIWSIMKFSLNKINKQNIIETIRRDNI